MTKDVRTTYRMKTIATHCLLLVFGVISSSLESIAANIIFGNNSKNETSKNVVIEFKMLS